MVWSMTRMVVQYGCENVPGAGHIGLMNYSDEMENSSFWYAAEFACYSYSSHYGCGRVLQ